MSETFRLSDGISFFTVVALLGFSKRNNYVVGWGATFIEATS